MIKLAKKIFSVRLDVELVEEVRSLGFTLTEAIESALKLWISRQKSRK